MRIVSQIIAEAQNALRSLPADADISNPPCLIPRQTMSPEKEEMLQKVSKAFHEDFSLRRCMLLKRLDVTIDSFLWGEKAQVTCHVFYFHPN